MRRSTILLRLAPTVFLAPLIVSAGLAANGADRLADALALTVCLIGALMLAIAVAPRALLHEAFARNGLSATAALAFLALAAATVAPLPSELARLLTPPMAAGLSSNTISVAPTSTILGALLSVGAFAAFALGALAGTSERARTAAVRTLIVLATAFAVLALFHFTSVRNPRFDAGLPSPNATAVVFGCVAVLALAVMARALRHATSHETKESALARQAAPIYLIAKTPVSALAILVALICTLMTGSRGGAIVVALGVGVLFAATWTSWAFPVLRRRTSILWGVCAALALAVLGAYAAAPLVERLGAGVSSTSGRGQLVGAHFQAFLERPWLGHGLGSFDPVNQTLLEPSNYQALRDAGTVHNIYVQALEETGLAGLILLGLMLAAPMMRAASAFRPNRPGREWRAAALAMSAIVLLQGAFDFALQTPAVAAFYLFSLGLLVQPRSEHQGREHHKT